MVSVERQSYVVEKVTGIRYQVRAACFRVYACHVRADRQTGIGFRFHAYIKHRTTLIILLSHFVPAAFCRVFIAVVIITKY